MRMKKAIRKVLSLVLTAAMALTLSVTVTMTGAEAAGTVWDGTADTSWYNTTDTTFTLTTAEQLAGLAEIVNADTDTFEGKTILLGADIYLNSSAVTADDDDNNNQWTPIGNYATSGGVPGMGGTAEPHYFCGTFDGRGHMVYNLYIDYPRADSANPERNALFGNNMGTIQNVGVTGYVHTFRNGASIAGWNAGTIQYCYGGCYIRANGGGGRRGSAGITGTNFGSVLYCRSDSNVYNDYRCAGGIVGQNVADTIDGVSYSGLVDHCLFTGYVDAALDDFAGAIASTNYTTITQCYYLEGSSADGAGVTTGYSDNTNGAESYEFDTNGLLTSDGTTSALTAISTPSGIYATGTGSYPVLYWEVSGYDFSEQTDHTVNVEQPSEGGTLTAEPSGTVAWGTDITLTATPAEDYKLLYYDVGGSHVTTPYFKATSDVTVTAVFEKLSGYVLTLQDTDTATITAKDADGNTIASGDRVEEGTVVTLTATVKSGAVPENQDYAYRDRFIFTTDDGTALNTDAVKSMTYTMGAEAVTISATADTSRKQWVDLADTSWYNTTDTTFTLTTAEQLAGVQALVEQGELFEGKTILLGSDIDLSNPDGTGSGRNWTAIGSQYGDLSDMQSYIYKDLGTLDASGYEAAVDEYGTLYYWDETNSAYTAATAQADGTEYYVPCCFMGTFDGQGYTVYNLEFQSDNSDYYGAGLFAVTNNATIQNVKVRGTIQSDREVESCAGILAYALGTETVQNCTNFVDVSGYTTEVTQGFGGIVGANYLGVKVTVTDCINYGAIAGVNGNDVGGIAGIGGNMTITSCMNYGEIQGLQSIGGIVGIQCTKNPSSAEQLVIQDCGNEGDVTCTVSAAAKTTKAYAGGILGSSVRSNTNISLTIDGCYNYGDVNGGTGYGVGGLIGFLTNGRGTSAVTNSYNTGHVSTAFIGNSALYANGVGGLVGNAQFKGTIGTNCYNTGTVESTVSGASVYVGSIVGVNRAANSSAVTTGYYLDTSCENGYGYSSTGDVSGITSMTSDEMKAADFVTTLGSSYKAAATINDLYPILQWQTDAERYTVTAAETEHGSVTVSVPIALAGDTVTVTYDADTAYLIDTVGYYTTDETSVTEITADADGVYSFTMPAADTTVVCTFKEDPTVVCTVFGTALNMAQLLAYPTTTDVTDLSGTTVSCTGILLSDILTNYVAAPDGMVAFTVANQDGDYTVNFYTSDLEGMMLAWETEGYSTLADYEVRLIVPGTARGKWVNDVGSITERVPVFTYTDGTDTSYIFESDIEAVTPVNTTLSYTSGSGTNEVTADFYSVTDLLTQIGVTLPDTYCSLTVTAGDGFAANVADQTVPNLYVYQTDSGDWRSAIDGTAGRYWVKDVETITLNTDHSYGDDYICTVCGEEETYFTLTYGDTSAKVYASMIESAGTEATMSYTSQGTQNEVTAVFADFETLAGEAGVTLPDDWCYTTVTASDGFAKNIDHTKDLKFYVTDSGQIRSAVDSSGGSLWVNDVTTAVVTKDHTYGEDHVCTVCGDAEPSMTVSVGGETVTVYASDILSVGEETTMSYSGRSGTTEVTTQFAALDDLVSQAGLTMPEDFCNVTVTASDGFSAVIPYTSDVYFYLTDVNQIRSAVDGSAGRYWVNDVVSAEAVTEHTYEGTGHICTVCGTETADPSACPAANFTDLPDYPKWSHKAIDYVYVNGIMSGTSSTTFTPYGEVTRAQVMQVLYKMSGEEGVAYSGTFSDVPQDKWYTDAVAWAASRGIASGYTDGTFRPNESVSRQQLAAFLYRYAAYKGLDVTAQADLSAYTDQSDISSYARTAMSWTVAEGYIAGTSDTTLSPKGTATRVQMAAILQRFGEQTT